MAIEGTPVAVAAGILHHGAGELVGYSVRETSGTVAASIVLHDSLDNTGPIIEEITLTAGESADDEWDRPGRLINTGVFAVITGSVEGSIFL